MSNFIRSAALAALALMGLSSLSACSSVTMPANLAGLGTNSMSMLLIHKNRDYNNGVMTDKEYSVVIDHANDCLHDVRQQQAGLGEVMLTNGGIEAAGGFVGGFEQTNVTAALLHEALRAGALPAVGAGTAAYTGAMGVAEAPKIKSNAVTSIVGQCTNGDLHDPRTASKVVGVHVYGSELRTNNSSDKNHLPAWVMKTNDPFTEVPENRKTDTSDPQSH